MTDSASSPDITKPLEVSPATNEAAEPVTGTGPRWRMSGWLAASIALAFIISSALGFNTASGASTQQYVQIKVQSGDTLWTLAQEYGPSDMDVRNVIYEICRLNGITAADLQAGQYITIPTEL